MNIFEDPSRSVNRTPPSGWPAEMERLANALSQSADCELISGPPRRGSPSAEFDDFARDLSRVLGAWGAGDDHNPYSKYKDEAAAALKAGADAIRARVAMSGQRGIIFDSGKEISSGVWAMVLHMERVALAYQDPLEYKLILLENLLSGHFTNEEIAACRAVVAAMSEHKPPSHELT